MEVLADQLKNILTSFNIKKVLGLSQDQSPNIIITFKDQKQKRIGPIKNDEQELVYDDTEKSGAMNKYFSTIGEELAKVFQGNNSQPQGTEVHMYADDTTAFEVGDSVDEVVQKLREALSQMNNWCSQNKLTVNAKKSKAMLITTKKFIGPLLPVQMGRIPRLYNFRKGVRSHY
eukprot:gene8026-13936_t